MKMYKKPIIEVLLFDEEKILTISAKLGYSSAQGVTTMMAEDAGWDKNPKANVSITTVNISGLSLD